MTLYTTVLSCRTDIKGRVTLGIDPWLANSQLTPLTLGTQQQGGTGAEAKGRSNDSRQGEAPYCTIELPSNQHRNRRKAATAARRTMALCCIGGVCVPYSAILPLLALGLKWVVEKLVAAGLLPTWMTKQLARFTSVRSPPVADGASACCAVSTAPAASSSACTGAKAGVVTEMESPEAWQQFLAANKTVVVKFTATWCRPCKAIQPTYALLASDYGTAAFCSIDVDELDEVAASLQVAMMPTFCVFQGGAVVERYAGSSEDQLRAFLAKHLQA